MSASASVLVLAPNWLGDAVMALPAIADLRRRFVEGRLTVAARSSVAGLFGMVPQVDDVVELTWSGRWWARTAFHSDAARLADVAADVAVLLPNSFAAAWLVVRARVPERWGYATDLRGRLLTRAVGRPRRSMHQAAYYQHLTHALDVPRGPLPPTLAVSERAKSAAAALLRSRGWNPSRPLVAFAPGAAYGTAKRWIPAHVASLVGRLISERGATCALVGSRADSSTTSLVSAMVPPASAAQLIDLAGETTLETLAGVFALARACVSNDSGAMHVAAAVGTPVTAIFGPTREHETAPLTPAGGRAEVLTHPVWCRPCMLRECPLDHRCMTRLTPERVFLSVERLMAGAAR